MKRQKGVSLVETLGVLAVSGTLLAGMTFLAQQWTERIRGSNTALWHQTLNAAVTAYVKDNYATLVATASASTPVAVSVPTLQAGNYLSPGFAVANSYGQVGCALVLQPVANRLEVLVAGEGGRALSEFDAGPIAAEIGSSGGFMYSATNARGAFGNWNINTANYTSSTCSGTAATTGRIASLLWFTDGQLLADYVYRNTVAGHPEANSMNTPFILGSSTIQTLNAACTTNGAIGRDANGGVLSCQLGQWKSQGSAYWQDPVANLASLPACTAATAWQTRQVQAATVGSGPHAYTCDGATWRPLSVDDSGNLTVSGNYLTGTLGVGVSTVSTVGAPCAAGSVSKTVSGGVLFCDSALTYRLAPAGSVSASTFQVAGVVTLNSACPSGTADNGRVARTVDGALLSCQSGVWKKATGTIGGDVGGMYTIGTFSGACITPNPATGSCSCPPGYAGYISGFGWSWSQWDQRYHLCGP